MVAGSKDHHKTDHVTVTRATYGYEAIQVVHVLDTILCQQSTIVFLLTAQIDQDKRPPPRMPPPTYRYPSASGCHVDDTIPRDFWHYCALVG
jgi:hypothetical protein